ncbi:MAG TPA: aldo/keto reductase, partial [bacterium]|nr:aldo/keto reductase [bacterium]
MKTRILGKGPAALEVSSVGLGCMGMSTTAYGPAPEGGAMIDLIAKAVDLGVTFFDTAEAYGPWANESLVGQALAPFKGRVVVATKFGFNIDPATAERKGGANSRPAQIRSVAEASLKRLGVEAIDLFYQHRV